MARASPSSCRKNRREWRGLFPEALDQLSGVDSRVARDVVDRLLGIERRALAPGIVEHVDDVAVQPHHAAFEHREQADGPRAYDDDVGLVRMSVGHRLKVEERNHKIKPPVVRDRGPNLVAGGGLEPPTPAL